MVDEIKPPEAPPATPPPVAPKSPPHPAPKKGMHGGVAFVIGFPVGVILGVGLVFAGSAVFEFIRPLWGVAAIGCVFLAIVLGAVGRFWGMAGFVLGLTVPMCFMALLYAACGGGRGY